MLRWARAAVLATVTVGVSAVAHDAAAGHLPGPLGLAGCAVVTTALLAALLGRPASAARIVVLLAAGQTALHAAFGALAGHTPTGVSSGSSGVSSGLPGVSSSPSGVSSAAALHEHGHHAVAHPTGNIGTGPVETGALGAGPFEPGGVLDPRMALVHAVAAVVLGLWLAIGERVVWRMVVLLAAPVADLVGRVRLALLLALALPGAARPAHGPARPSDAPDAVPLRQVLLAVCAPRRGPPVAPAR